MKKKEIKIISNFYRSGIEFKQNQIYIVAILLIGFDTDLSETPFSQGTEGHSRPCAIVEFENGKIMRFDIDRDIHIVGNAE